MHCSYARHSCGLSPDNLGAKGSYQSSRLGIALSLSAVVDAYITPVPKPRMTRRDRWLDPPRPGVARYREFKDNIGAAFVDAGHNIQEMDVYGVRVIAWLPMPKSWSEKRKSKSFLTPHRQTPDADNILKAVCDALLDNDSGVWLKEISKFWSREPHIKIEILYTEKGQ